MRIQFDEAAVDTLRTNLLTSNPDTHQAREVINGFLIDNYVTISRENLANLIDFRLIREKKAFKVALEQAARYVA